MVSTCWYPLLQLADGRYPFFSVSLLLDLRASVTGVLPIMDDNLVYITDNVSIPISELSFRFARSSGPGGQHVNRSATQVELLFDATDGAFRFATAHSPSGSLQSGLEHPGDLARLLGEPSCSNRSAVPRAASAASGPPRSGSSSGARTPRGGGRALPGPGSAPAYT